MRSSSITLLFTYALFFGSTSGYVQKNLGRQPFHLFLSPEKIDLANFASSTRQQYRNSIIVRHMVQTTPQGEEQIVGISSEKEKDEKDNKNKAITGTVNDRLMEELESAARKEKFGARSAAGKKYGFLDSFKSTKTDEERQASIDEARNLNGVNPVVALTGSLFAFAGAYGLWMLTNFLAAQFALHPLTGDVYFVNRVAGVFRNVVMGLVSLASGFFAVTGLGIFLLGVRVGYGVITGELDPTPIKNKDVPQLEDLPNMWDLMTNKRPGRRRR